jgi:hypothetical protein
MNVAMPSDMLDDDRRMHSSPPRHNSWLSMGGSYPEGTKYLAYNMHPGVSMHSGGGSVHGGNFHGSVHAGNSMHSGKAFRGVVNGCCWIYGYGVEVDWFWSGKGALVKSTLFRCHDPCLMEGACLRSSRK